MASRTLPSSLASINPPLINSSNPWATTKKDLTALYNCPYTGAVTTRTSLLNGFAHDESIHRYCFFDVNDGCCSKDNNKSFSKGRNDEEVNAGDLPQGKAHAGGLSALNNLGYSPIRLDEYLKMVQEIVTENNIDHHYYKNYKSKKHGNKKLFIISVTGTPSEISACYSLISQTLLTSQSNGVPLNLAMEINLSCPNIHDRPPPAYEKEGLVSYLTAIEDVRSKVLAQRRDEGAPLRSPLPVTGIKLPPYTYSTQFQMLESALLESSKPLCPIEFITSTNTLGTSLVLSPSQDSSSTYSASLPTTGLGGMSGPALHPLALGNVQCIRAILDKHPKILGEGMVAIIGIGGVSDGDGFKRMKGVGADIVGVGTALGVKGVGVFEGIVETDWMEIAGENERGAKRKHIDSHCS